MYYKPVHSITKYTAGAGLRKRETNRPVQSIGRFPEKCHDPFRVRNPGLWAGYNPGRGFLETEIKKQRREEAPTSL